ncbi:heterokaryon incompatibility protein-domain-containing protein [Scleroderma yunnanense]
MVTTTSDAVKAFLEREELIREERRVDRRVKVLEFRDDETTAYVILSHRWIDQEVNYDEMIGLAKMEKDDQDEVRQRNGYRKILDSCEQAKGDGYEWLWVDTCCIDKQSSAELSEAINSMYQWHENARVCYAYLHDVLRSSFPSAIPQNILTDGLSSNRPCVAQIMSWAVYRTTTRVEDRAYSLLGLLDVNMSMLYGEGKKAFHRLQLEIIRVSNDQSIFAWSFNGGSRWTGSILADDPSLFRNCAQMELMDPNEFIKELKEYIAQEDLSLIAEDRLSTFPTTNRGIQIWMLLTPVHGSRSVFRALLPCRRRPWDPWDSPVSIDLALWKSNYYRYSTSRSGILEERTLRFHQLYLGYQDTLHHNTTFEIDDSGITGNGFTYRGTYPSEFTGNTLTLTSTDRYCVKFYFNIQAGCHLAVGFGQCFSQDWVHSVCEISAIRYSWENYVQEECWNMLVRGPEDARSMAEARSRGKRYGRVRIIQTRLPRPTWFVQTSCVVWESSRNCAVRIEALRHPDVGKLSGEWSDFDVDRTDDPSCDMRGLMIDRPWLRTYGLLVDGVFTKFSQAPIGIKLGDFGRWRYPNYFHCEGNIFEDLETLASELDITPRQHKICAKNPQHTDGDYVTAPELYKPLGLSLPRSHHFNSLLASLSTRLTNRYLVTRVMQCPAEHTSRWQSRPAGLYGDRRSDTNGSSIEIPLCTIGKPLVWHRDKRTGSVLVEGQATS